MNREIKFRVWDNTKQRMFCVRELFWRYSRYEMVGNYWFLENENDRYGREVWFPRTEKDGSKHTAVLMQFTGFKDRNGRDIYEGDILFSHALDVSHTNDDYHLADGGVALPAGSLLFAHVKKDPLNVPVVFSDTSLLEVIGNIYEHPQLLEVQP